MFFLLKLEQGLFFIYFFMVLLLMLSETILKSL